MFEVSFGRLVLGASCNGIASDFDVRCGGLLPLGLLIMALSPVMAVLLSNSFTQ